MLGLCRLLGFFRAFRIARIAATLGALAACRPFRLLATGAGLGRNPSRGQHLDKLAHRGRELASALIYDRQRTEEGSLLELEHLERAARDLVLNSHPRHDRASEADFDRALDSLD